MRSIIAIVFLSAFISTSHAQVTVSGQFVSQANKISGGISPNGLVDQIATGYEVGLGYWFRLKNKRLEFTPEISYTYLGGSDALAPGDIKGININTNILIYALDFHSDCSACPTFSKEGGLIKKGFHWIINPTFYNYSSSYDGQESISNFRLSAGAGLDIGLTNMITLVPFVTYGFGLKENLFGNPDNKPKQLKLGIRSIFRFDKNKW